MRVEELITRLREDYLDDTLGVDNFDSLVSEKALLRFASEAQLQATRRGDLVYDEDTAEVCNITLVTDQRGYSFHSAINRIKRVSYNGENLCHVTEKELDRENKYWRTLDTGVPVKYYIRSRKIYLVPAPSLLEIGKPLELAVYRSQISDFKNIRQYFELAEEEQQDLIYWMLYRVYNLRDEDLYDPNASAMYKGLFEESYGPVIPARVRTHQFESPELLTHIQSDKYAYTGDSDLTDDDFDKVGWS